jgi:hypothetical protein
MIQQENRSRSLANDETNFDDSHRSIDLSKLIPQYSYLCFAGGKQRRQHHKERERVGRQRCESIFYFDTTINQQCIMKIAKSSHSIVVGTLMKK